MFRSMGAFSTHARGWAIDHALPLWAEAGFDEPLSLFVEKLDLAGRPLASVPRRLTMQARQIYVFAHAALLGWYPQGRALALRGAHAMIERYSGPSDGQAWAFTVAGDGTPREPSEDAAVAATGNGMFYAHAFALFGLAWAHRLEPDPRFSAARDAILGFLDMRLRHEAGGYRPSLGSDGAAMFQNPHMHFLEAMLAWWEATGDRRFMARGEEILALFRSRFFQPRPGVLAEYFDANWAALAGPRGHLWEPGHHFEWVWLLHRFAAAQGAPIDPRADALYRHACAFGQAPSGRVFDELSDDGGATRTSSRCWPQTEAIKAHAALYEAGDAGAEARALPTANRLFASFLGHPVSGGWIDQVDGADQPIAEAMPATTLYHAFLAIAETNRVWPAI